jgi:hypothetical protein
VHIMCGSWPIHMCFFSRSHVGHEKCMLRFVILQIASLSESNIPFQNKTWMFRIILLYQWIRHVMFKILDAVGYFQYLYCLWAMTSHDEAQVRRVALTLEWSSRFRHLAYCPEPVQEPPSPLILRSGGPSHKFLKDNSHQAQYVVVLQFCLACLSWKASKFARKKSHSLCRFTLLSNLGSHPLGSQY